MSFEGSFWVGNTFVRDVAAREKGRVVYPDLEMGGRGGRGEGESEGLTN
jgi:hypothetical protein